MERSTPENVLPRLKPGPAQNASPQGSTPFHRNVLWLILSLFSSLSPLHAEVQINEVMASNTRAFPDITDFEDYPDWLELKNTAATPSKRFSMSSGQKAYPLTSAAKACGKSCFPI